MLRQIIICDDDEVLVNRLKNKVEIALQNIKEDNSKYQDLKTNIEVFTDALRLIGYTQVTDISNAIFFLDIELNQDQNGVNIAEKIRQSNPNAQIIFVTAYDKYAPLTYRRRIGAIDYINKSESDVEIMKRLNETLLDALENLENAENNRNNQFLYKIGRRTQQINQSDVVYIMNSSIQHKVVMLTKHGEAEFRGNISQIKAKNSFLMQISQSCLINPENVIGINTREKYVLLSNNSKVRYTRTYNQVVKKLRFDKGI